MPRCIHCNNKFEKRYPKQQGELRYCLNTDECTSAFWDAVKEQRIKQAKREKAKRNKEEMSKDKFRATYIQPLMNEIARLIDKDQPCIATGNYGKMAGGHRHSVGDSRHLSLNLHNIHIQSWQSNDRKGGDHVKYRAGIINTYGRDYANFIDETLIQCPQKLWSKSDLERIQPMLSGIIKELKEANKVYNERERVELRNALNQRIGIYPDKYGVFTTHPD